ncbi:hypothetical protein B484DRAFT_399881, partial [Ochromonadaceae sp. CCMP2298]
MGTGQTREAAAAKGVTNGQESKGQRGEEYSWGARQDKLAWSAHGVDNAADVPLPASADGKWAPGEQHAATVVRGWIQHAASKEGRDSWETRPPPGSESDSGEGEETDPSVAPAAKRSTTTPVWKAIRCRVRAGPAGVGCTRGGVIIFVFGGGVFGSSGVKVENPAMIKKRQRGTGKKRKDTGKKGKDTGAGAK